MVGKCLPARLNCTVAFRGHCERQDHSGSFVPGERTLRVCHQHLLSRIRVGSNNLAHFLPIRARRLVRQAHHACLPGDVNSRGRYEHRMPSVNGCHVQSARSPLIALTRSTQPVVECLNGRNIQTLSVAEVCGLPLDEAQRCSAIYSGADLLHLPILKTKIERATILRKQLSEVLSLIHISEPTRL